MAGTEHFFFSRYERALRAAATGGGAGRLSAEVEVTITDLSGGDPRNVHAAYQLMGPGDVQRLAPGAIVRRYPAPGCRDAEETKLAMVEFNAPDLPWRYTPQLPADEKLRPWLVLVVGLAGPQGLTVRQDGSVRVSSEVQAEHPLESSWRWAHVHQVGSYQKSRLLSPVDLARNSRYVAALVPAFGADGAKAWTGARPVSLPCYDWWEFSTGPEGDFPSLARQLKRADLLDLQQRGGRPFGRADLQYQARHGGPVWSLPAAGALRVPSDAVSDPSERPPPPLVAFDVAALRTPIHVPDGRDVITVPDYPGTFLASGTTRVAGGWALQLDEDPRLRGAAGLGAWAAIEWQNRIAAAAAARLGDTVLAAERIRALALGVAASRSMWRRRLPVMDGEPDRIDPVRALAVLAPVLARLPARGGTTVLDAVGGHTPQLGPALFSSAARRALRPGPARALRAELGAQDLARLLTIAGDCPDATEVADPLAQRKADPQQSRIAAAKAAIYGATDDAQLATQVAEQLLGNGADVSDSWTAWLAAALQALTPGPDGRTDRNAVRSVLDSRDHRRLEDPARVWAARPDEHAPLCRKVDIGRLGEAVIAAIDPTVAVPPAARRVYATLPGVDSMRPLEVEPEVDIPLWSFLSAQSPDWMLPGVGDLAEHEVVGVETNPMFVQAFLAGANWQASSELRWRNVPLVPRSSPLRKFWQRPVGLFDMKPARFWPVATPLGDASLAPDVHGSEAVIVFKTPIFRRYPATVVYLYDARPQAGQDPAWDSPPSPNTPLEEARRVEPTFTGTIGPDVTFFGFPVPASALESHWVVLEEPPAGYRFNAQPSATAPALDQHGGQYARKRFALPVRVLMGPLL